MELRELIGDAYKEGMTIEEVSQAIKGLNLVNPDTLPPSVSKETFDKTASELAALKREKKERMSAEEQEQAQRQEVLDQLSALQKENGRMKQEKALLAAGYDAETAAVLAGHIVEGNVDKFVQVQTNWLSKQKESIYAQVKQELLQQTPGINTGDQQSEHLDVDLGAALGKAKASSMASSNEILEKFM